MLSYQISLAQIFHWVGTLRAPTLGLAQQLLPPISRLLPEGRGNSLICRRFFTRKARLEVA